MEAWHGTHSIHALRNAATEAVAAILGELNRIGYFPVGDSRLRAVYYSALGYIQSGAEKALTADPKYTDITFAMLASVAPGFTPSADGQRIIDRTLQSVIERWKSLTVQDKIEAALLLISYKPSSRSIGNHEIGGRIFSQQSAARHVVAIDQLQRLSERKCVNCSPRTPRLQYAIARITSDRPHTPMDHHTESGHELGHGTWQ